MSNPLEPTFYEFEKMDFEELNDKVSRRYIYGKNAMLVCFKLKTGAVVPKHHHVSEQITYILEGRVRVLSEGKEYFVGKGEVLIIPSNVYHEFYALEDTIDIDIFSPLREDWLSGKEDYLKNVSSTSTSSSTLSSNSSSDSDSNSISSSTLSSDLASSSTLNSDSIQVTEKRGQLLNSIFQGKTPDLWCPLLTHYTDNGEIDKVRNVKHLQFLSSYVKGFLLAGSTGDGWELSMEELKTLLPLMLNECTNLNLHALIGVLRKDSKETLFYLEQLAQYLKINPLHSEVPPKSFAGFTVCAPYGKTKSDAEITNSLKNILALNFPTALYQLPQITDNEISPKCFLELSKQFPNFIMFKDTSGKDNILKTISPQRNKDNIVCLRGAEGDYSQWIRSNGGPYEGFLLSSANCFAKELRKMLESIQNLKMAEALEISLKISRVMEAMFILVSSVKMGNAFTNSNKAIDHFNAYGPEAVEVKPPRLHGGGHLPKEIIQETKNILLKNQLLPEKGYLN